MRKPTFFIINYIRDLFVREKPVVRCIRCKRPLKDPKSIERGYGIVCWRKGIESFMDAIIKKTVLNSPKSSHIKVDYSNKKL